MSFRTHHAKEKWPCYHVIVICLVGKWVTFLFEREREREAFKKIVTPNRNSRALLFRLEESAIY